MLCLIRVEYYIKDVNSFKRDYPYSYNYFNAMSSKNEIEFYYKINVDKIELGKVTNNKGLAIKIPKMEGIELSLELLERLETLLEFMAMRNIALSEIIKYSGIDKILSNIKDKRKSDLYIGVCL